MSDLKLYPRGRLWDGYSVRVDRETARTRRRAIGELYRDERLVRSFDVEIGSESIVRLRRFDGRQCFRVTSREMTKSHLSFIVPQEILDDRS